MKKEYTFKFYAKEAKERLKNGFWEEKEQHWNNLKNQAASEGRSAESDVRYERSELAKKLYNRDSYEEEDRFYKKVCEIMSSEKVITNPIKVLCDMEGVNEMPIERRSQMVLE
ncbi:MAG: hypothetical protein RR307_02905, partial [Clostridia bacterium]